MIVVVGLILLLRFVGVFWSLVFWRRTNDWRLGALGAVLVFALYRNLDRVFFSPDAWLKTEIPVSGALGQLILSSLILVAVVLMERLFSQLKQTTDELAQIREELEERVEDRTLHLTEANEHLRKEIAERERIEGEYGALTENIEDCLYETDLDGNLTRFNPATQRMLKYSVEELAGLNYREFTDARPARELRRAFYGVYKSGVGEKGYVWELTAKDGEKHIVESSVSLRLNDQGEPLGFRGIFRDITERKKAEEALRESEERLKIVFEYAPDACYLTDLNGAFVDGNRAAEKMIGLTRDKVIGKSFFDLNMLPPDQVPVAAEILKKSIEGFPSGPDELQLIRANGEKFHIEIRTYPIAIRNQRFVLGIGRDVTERKQAEAEKDGLERQLLQSQKLEAIGTLAGGIAHDFNNLLTGILGYANMLKLDRQDDPEIVRAASVIETAAERAAELTGQLLGFARKGKLRDTEIDVHATIQEVVSLLSRTIDKNIEIAPSLRASNPMIKGDPTQIQQVILNLAVNARDAMQDGGRLLFGTDLVEFKEGSKWGETGLPNGSYLVLSVTDTGQGIAPKDQDHIFEPFFTTKEQGKGTGMGLATAYGIVKNHGGLIRMTSEVGEGTTFQIFLPTAPPSEASEPEAGRSSDVIKGSGRILVVDDEEVVQDSVSQMLQSLGYTVTLASDGEIALEKFKETSVPFDLVIVDMVMPNMGGRDCCRKLKELQSDVRVILSSGYGQEGEVQEIMNEGVRNFIQKPYRLGDLSDVVAQALEEAT